MLSSYKLEVGSVPVRVNSSSQGHRPARLWLRVVEPKESALTEIWIGPENVTPETGLYVDQGETPLEIVTTPGEQVWAVAEDGANTVEVRVLCSVV